MKCQGQKRKTTRDLNDLIKIVEIMVLVVIVKTIDCIILIKNLKQRLTVWTR